MQTVQIRLSPEQVISIDQKIKKGIYQSRSEAIRDYIRRIEFFDAVDQFRKLTAEAGLTEEEILREDEQGRKKLFRKLFASPS